MRFEDREGQICIDAEFDTGSAGPVRCVDGVYEISPQPEPVSPWFTAALEEHFGGAGVPREYACHVRVTSLASADGDAGAAEPAGADPGTAEAATGATAPAVTAATLVTIRFLFSETNGKSYMDPPYWIWRQGRWWPLGAGQTRFTPDESVELDVKVPAGGSVQVANKPYVTSADVEGEMQALAAQGPFVVEQIGTTADGRPLNVLASTRNDGSSAAETILVGATMQPAEPAARPVLAVAHALADGSALSRRLLDRFRFVLVPLPNPDGTAQGRSCTNGQGQVPMFSFGRLLDAQDDVPEETAALWAHAQSLRPAAYVEFHTHYQDCRSHKLNPMSADWFDPERHADLERVNESLLGLNQDWRVTPIEPSTPLCRAGKFTNLADQFGTLAYCYQIYCVSEESTAWHASTVVMTLACALAGEAWCDEEMVPTIMPG